MRALLTFILLLLTTPVFAGQGMGPGPGIYRVAMVAPTSAPSSVSASNSPAQITVTWGAVSGATSYNVYYNTTNSSGSATKISSATTGLSYSINGPLTSGTTYYVWVSAQNGAGEGPLSSSASAVAAAVPPDAYFASTLEGWTASDCGLSYGTGRGGGNSVYGNVEGYYDEGSEEDVNAGFGLTKSITLAQGQTISFWYRLSAGATIFVSVSGSGNSTGTYTPVTDNTWRQITYTLTSAQGTDKNVVITIASAPGAGNFATGYIDDISITGP